MDGVKKEGTLSMKEGEVTIKVVGEKIDLISKVNMEEKLAEQRIKEGERKFNLRMLKMVVEKNLSLTKELKRHMELLIIIFAIYIVIGCVSLVV